MSPSPAWATDTTCGIQPSPLLFKRLPWQLVIITGTYSQGQKYLKHCPKTNFLHSSVICHTPHISRLIPCQCCNHAIAVPKTISTLMGRVKVAIDGKGVSFFNEGTDLSSKMSDLQKCLDTFVPDCRGTKSQRKECCLRTKYLTSLDDTYRYLKIH